MKHLVTFLVALCCLTDYYSVTVTRKDKDLYLIEGSAPKVYIETRYCYDYAMMDKAILKYEAYAVDNTLLFSSGTKCDVKGLR